VIAASTLVIVVFISLLINRAATVALMSTGLSRDMARFQARSALTGVGYTTTESESIVNHPVRRRVVMLLMLVGNAGLVTILATLVVSLAGAPRPAHQALRLGLIVAGLAVIFFLSQSPGIDRWLTRQMARLVSRFTEIEARDYVSLLQLSGDYAVTELRVEPEGWLANRRLDELRLAQEGVLVLGIQRTNGEYLGAPRGETVVRGDDELVLYGRADVLTELDRRRRDASGEAAHRRAIARQDDVRRGQEDARSG
jgi:hypothetical protein